MRDRFFEIGDSILLESQCLADRQGERHTQSHWSPMEIAARHVEERYMYSAEEKRWESYDRNGGSLR